MKGGFLYINSMSRSGTSLLYQLLYGHPDIHFPPFRIQFACSKPLGFPIANVANSRQEFAKLLLGKTTTPLNLSSDTNWSNIDIQSLEKQGFLIPDELIESLPYNPENSTSSSIFNIILCCKIM